MKIVELNTKEYEELVKKGLVEEEKKDNFTGWKMYQDGKEVCSMDCSVEEKKVPEKLDDFDLTTYSRDDEDLGLELNYTGVSNTFNDVYFKINEIIDFLKAKENKYV